MLLAKPACVIIEEEKLSTPPIAGACDNKYPLISILPLAAMILPNVFRRSTCPYSFAVFSLTSNQIYLIIEFHSLKYHLSLKV